MSTFVTTYVIFWLAVALYVMRLGGRQRALLERMASLQLRLQESADPQRPILEESDFRSNEIVLARKAG